MIVDDAASPAEPARTADDKLDDGRPVVDSTLIEATLRLSPLERIRQNDRMVNMARKLREAFANSDGRSV